MRFSSPRDSILETPCSDAEEKIDLIFFFFFGAGGGHSTRPTGPEVYGTVCMYVCMYIHSFYSSVPRLHGEASLYFFSFTPNE